MVQTSNKLFEFPVTRFFLIDVDESIETDAKNHEAETTVRRLSDGFEEEGGCTSQLLLSSPSMVGLGFKSCLGNIKIYFTYPRASLVLFKIYIDMLEEKMFISIHW